MKTTIQQIDEALTFLAALGYVEGGDVVDGLIEARSTVLAVADRLTFAADLLQGGKA